MFLILISSLISPIKNNFEIKFIENKYLINQVSIINEKSKIK